MGRFLLILQALLLAMLAVSPTAPPATGPGDPVARFAAQSGVPAAFRTRDGARFELVPPGTFSWRAPSGDAHAVTLRVPYYIEAEAVGGLSWNEARDRARSMTAANGDHVYRLPTEAEAAWAARHHPDAGDAVRELWCADGYGPRPEQDLSDPVGPRAGSERVVLGSDGGRRGAAPSHRDGRIGVRLVAELGWRGDREVALRTVTRDRAGRIVEEKTGYRIRLIRILDRLADRQAGRTEEWTELDGTTPLALRMFPGRYYVTAVDDDVPGTPRVGPELKIHVGAGPHAFDVDVPGPRTASTRDR